MANDIDTLLDPIECVITDCDGILTDGKIYLTGEGEQIKAFHAHDGSGIKLLQQFGFLVSLISGRDSPPLAERAEELDFDEFFPGSDDKIEPYRTIRQKHDLSSQQICYLGDDLTDLQPFEEAGFSATVPDASDEIRKRADYITDTRGGNGAFREVAELLLKAHNSWNDVLDCYR